MVISMAMASDVVIIVCFVISRGMGVKKKNFLKIRLKGKKMNFFALWKKVKLLFLKWSWFDWKSRHHGYLETKATLKVKKTVDFKIKVLLSFLKSGRQENHIISKISICTISAPLVLLRGKGRLKLSSNSHVHSHRQTRWKREGLLLLQ